MESYIGFVIVICLVATYGTLAYIDIRGQEEDARKRYIDRVLGR